MLSAYKAYFFGMAKVASPFAMSCVLSAVGLFALIINACVVVKFGRRRLLTMNGLVICGFLQLIIAVVYQTQGSTIKAGKILVALSCLYMMSYNVSYIPRLHTRRPTDTNPTAPRLLLPLTPG